MNFETQNTLRRFFVWGISHHESPADIRECYALNLAERQEFYLWFERDLLILTTCNRTEIYAYDHSPEQVMQRWLRLKRCPMEEFDIFGYFYQGTKAIEQLFSVANGIDSKVIGDYQIIGQLKEAYIEASTHLYFNTPFSRLLQEVFQSSKTVKNQTSFSDGSSSVAYLCLKYIQQHANRGEKIAVVGFGQMGKLLTKYLTRHYIDVSIINRSQPNFDEFQNQSTLSYYPINQLNKLIENSNIIVSAIQTDTCIITADDVPADAQQRIFIDLSVPQSIHPKVNQLINCRLVNIDELSIQQCHTLDHRKLQLPKVKLIIDKHMKQFINWLDFTLYTPILQKLQNKLAFTEKEELKKLSDNASLTKTEVEQILHQFSQKIFRHCIGFIKIEDTLNRQSIETLQRLIQHK